MGRRELREQIFLLLFRVEFNEPSDMPEQVRMFFETDGFSDEEVKWTKKDHAYITDKYQKIMECLPELDKALGEKAENWDVSRMGKVELTVLRIAVYEITKDEEIPVGVAINEAVEIAKKFGQENAGAFVNAVLAKFA